MTRASVMAPQRFFFSMGNNERYSARRLKGSAYVDPHAFTLVARAAEKLFDG